MKNEKEAQNLKKWCHLWAQVNDFKFCNGWLCIALSFANILSYLIYFILLYTVSDISVFMTWLKVPCVKFPVHFFDI